MKKLRTFVIVSTLVKSSACGTQSSTGARVPSDPADCFDESRDEPPPQAASAIVSAAAMSVATDHSTATRVRRSRPLTPGCPRAWR
jgi:hypothetical protein